MVMELWAILKLGCGYLKLKLSVILPAWGWFVCLFFGGFFKGKIVCLPLISLGALFYFVSVVIATNPRMGFFFPVFQWKLWRNLSGNAACLKGLQAAWGSHSLALSATACKEQLLLCIPELRMAAWDALQRGCLRISPQSTQSGT